MEEFDEKRLEARKKFFSAMTEEMKKIWVRKEMDYGHAFDLMFRLSNGNNACVRILEKALRLQNVMPSGYKEKAGDDSLEQNLLDLANYAIMSLLAIQEYRKGGVLKWEADECPKDTGLAPSDADWPRLGAMTTHARGRSDLESACEKENENGSI